MEIYTKDGYARVTYDEEHDVIIFEWTNFSIGLDDVKVLHQKALDTAIQKNCWYFIAESSSVRRSFFDREVIRWWGQEWVPILIEAGLRAIVTVMPPSATANLSTRSWQSEILSGIVMKNVNTLNEAISFIEEIRQESHGTIGDGTVSQRP